MLCHSLLCPTLMCVVVCRWFIKSIKTLLPLQQSVNLIPVCAGVQPGGI